LNLGRLFKAGSVVASDGSRVATLEFMSLRDEVQIISFTALKRRSKFF